jgi:hypothetical protein
VYQTLKTDMKRTIPALILAGLILAAMASCKKDDDNSPSNGSTTSGTSTTSSGGSDNPLVKKACRGTAEIVVDGQGDTLYAVEAILPPFNLYGIYSTGTVHNITLQTGAKSLPATNTSFTVASDPEKFPGAKEMLLNYYSDTDETDYFAVSGTVQYTITTTEKLVKFSNITFKSDEGATKVISFELRLK